MSKLKLWLNISPYIPIIGIILVYFQQEKYNSCNTDIYEFGVNNKFICYSSAVIQALSILSLLGIFIFNLN